MKANLLSAGSSSARFYLLATISGLWGGFLAAGMGYVAASLVSQYIYRSLEAEILLVVQLWAIFGATHGVYYTVRSLAGGASYWAVLAGGFAAGLLMILAWSPLPLNLHYALLLLLPTLGALAGHQLIPNRFQKA
jgi:hypothetical protein